MFYTWRLLYIKTKNIKFQAVFFLEDNGTKRHIVNVFHKNMERPSSYLN